MFIFNIDLIRQNKKGCLDLKTPLYNNAQYLVSSLLLMVL
jgi:hypothetical protein